MVLPFIMAGLGAAVGAVAGACFTHAAGEKDRQVAQYHRKVANKLTVNYSALEKRYQQLERESQREIKELTRIHARNEMEKDLLHLALQLQAHIIRLMHDVQLFPTIQALQELKQAVDCTNPILLKLQEEPVQFSYAYYVQVYEEAEKKQVINAARSPSLTIAPPVETPKNDRPPAVPTAYRTTPIPQTNDRPPAVPTAYRTTPVPQTNDRPPAVPTAYRTTPVPQDRPEVNLQSCQEAIERAIESCIRREEESLARVAAFVNALYLQHKIYRAAQVGGSLRKRFSPSWFPHIQEREERYALEVDKDLEEYWYQKIRSEDSQKPVF